MTVRNSLPQFHLVPIQHPVDAVARSRQIKEKLRKEEKAQTKLRKEQRWPTLKSMESHLYQSINEIPDIVVQPATPLLSELEGDEGEGEGRGEIAAATWSLPISRPTNPRPSPQTLSKLLEPSLNTPRSAFPLAIQRETHVAAGEAPEIPFIDASFIYFAFLPAELRLQIWELALRRPKIIEAQFSSQYGAPTWVGRCARGPALLSVCQEAREMALCAEYAFLTPRQRDFGKRWSPSPFIPHLSQQPERALPFVPDIDTIFFRTLDRPFGSLQSIARNITGFESIQHLALTLPPRGLPLRNEWKACLGLFRDLKTLTFLVGGRDQSWFGDEEIEIRDLEEWFIDGRERTVVCDRWLLDVGEVGAFLSGKNFEDRMRGAWDENWRGVNVRVASWRKGA